MGSLTNRVVATELIFVLLDTLNEVERSRATVYDECNADLHTECEDTNRDMSIKLLYHDYALISDGNISSDAVTLLFEQKPGEMKKVRGVYK